MAKGVCNCGTVSFEISSDLTDIYVCHCSICRRATGSNGIAVVVVDNDNFTWTSGEDAITSWRKPDADWEMGFCGNCGSPVPGANDEKRKYVPAGLILEGAESLSVKHHIYVDSKAPWDEIGDDGQRHREAFRAG